MFLNKSEVWIVEDRDIDSYVILHVASSREKAINVIKEHGYRWYLGKTNIPMAIYPEIVDDTTTNLHEIEIKTVQEWIDGE